MMSQIEIRSADSSDLNVIYNLFVEIQSLHEKKHPEYFRKPQNDEIFTKFFEETLNHQEQFLNLICIDNVAQGYIHFQIFKRNANVFSNSRNYAHIHQVVVSQNYRKSGYATNLINHAKEQVSKLGIKELGIDHWSFNEAARNCFEKAGFKVLREDRLLKL